MVNEKELRELMIGFWETMVGIAVLIFTAYTVLKDFSVSKESALDRSILFVVILLIFLVIFYFIKKRDIKQNEQRIQSEGSIESKQPHETTIIQTQKQGNTPSRDYIKAKLDLLKMVITPSITAMFLIALYTIQTSGYNYNDVWIPIFLIGGFVVFLAKKYYEPLMNELK